MDPGNRGVNTPSPSLELVISVTFSAILCRIAGVSVGSRSIAHQSDPMDGNFPAGNA
jgi:hypothetical protein